MIADDTRLFTSVLSNLQEPRRQKLELTSVTPPMHRPIKNDHIAGDTANLVAQATAANPESASGIEDGARRTPRDVEVGNASATENPAADVVKRGRSRENRGKLTALPKRN